MKYKKILLLLIVLIVGIPLGIEISSVESGKDICSMNKNICEKVCNGQLQKKCTHDVPPSVCVTTCLR